MLRKTLLSSLLVVSLLGSSIMGAMAQDHKKMPARDPKTGKFLKKSDTATVATTAKKKMPPRDPKTGRFIKKGAGKMTTAPMGGKMAPMAGKMAPGGK